jgi:hypothetical protein
MHLGGIPAAFSGTHCINQFGETEAGADLKQRKNSILHPQKDEAGMWIKVISSVSESKVQNYSMKKKVVYIPLDPRKQSPQVSGSGPARPRLAPG